jgi:ketosteroid isomerase-like protein
MVDEGATHTLTSSRATSSVDGVEAPDGTPPLSKEETVTRLFEAFTRRELTCALGLLDPNVVFQPMTAQVTQAGDPYRGHEGIRRYAADVEAQWDELTLHPTQIRAAGEAVVALGLVSGSGRAGSFENAPTTWVYKFREGLVVHVQIFSEARNVYEALGDTTG